MKIAVFSLVYRDCPFIEVWLRHYSRHFEDIYLYNISGDKFLDKYKTKYKFTEVVKPIEWSSHALGVHLAKEITIELLKDHQWVLSASIDEIILPHPAFYVSFEQYIQDMNQPYHYCYAFEVLHEKDEANINWERPLLPQRQYWLRQTAYDKPLLTSVPLDWVEGFHNIKGHNDVKQNILPRGDQGLYLIHIHRIDNDTVKFYSRRDGFMATGSKEKIPFMLKTMI